MAGVSDIVYGDIEGTEDFDHFLSIGEGGGYEWDDLEAWYSPSRRRFYWLEGSGCSCNSLGDDVSSIADFLDGDREALMRAVKEKHESFYNTSIDAYERDKATVRDYKTS